MDHITYCTNRPITPSQFIELLRGTSLGERRPLDNASRVEQMVANANLMATAWDGATLVGVARCLTDFAYCCYLSDLAVAESHQRLGIGQGLLNAVRGSLHPQAKIILLAAPAARDYYPHIGFTRHDSAWLIQAGPPSRLVRA
jgi:GNAT superfamily N-acetyltransferase